MTTKIIRKAILWIQNNKQLTDIDVSREFDKRRSYSTREDEATTVEIGDHLGIKTEGRSEIEIIKDIRKELE